MKHEHAGAGGARIKLDRYDIAILRILSTEGRITKSRLAQEVNLSISPAWERVKRLETQGLIRGYRAEVDWAGAFTGSRVVVEVTLARHTAQDMRRFEERVAAAPEVIECLATGGGVDYVMQVLSRDIAHYQQFMDGLLDAQLGIERYFSYVVTKVVKSKADGLPSWAADAGVPAR
ncbi:Lrp/AsnC family transcriptional regulator [Burkholderia sp. Ac-20379]|uniref:Lrp/AsnC family transcriptional regulator n=1 Tax=Burkholderia sp. Ac-20379 TaxID=2703900 RepID=UPI001E182453|nr:Lrp/AsnC family transcriptional regulator [Burkholderia sp. Ac-20379]MBN3727068.1 Lrp/AsnC family transcriptional regulator [Burkholderia sp. Ac-20379]